MRLDPERHLASFAGAPLALTAIEFAILKAFVARPGMVFSRDQIMDRAYDRRVHVSNRTIDSHIRNIRA